MFTFNQYLLGVVVSGLIIGLTEKEVTLSDNLFPLAMVSFGWPILFPGLIIILAAKLKKLIVKDKI